MAEREREGEDGKAGWMGGITDGARREQGEKGSSLERRRSLGMGEAVSNGVLRLSLL